MGNVLLSLVDYPHQRPSTPPCGEKKCTPFSNGRRSRNKCQTQYRRPAGTMASTAAPEHGRAIPAPMLPDDKMALGSSSLCRWLPPVTTTTRRKRFGSKVACFPAAEPSQASSAKSCDERFAACVLHAPTVVRAPELVQRCGHCVVCCNPSPQQPFVTACEVDLAYTKRFVHHALPNVAANAGAACDRAARSPRHAKRGRESAPALSAFEAGLSDTVASLWHGGGGGWTLAGVMAACTDASGSALPAPTNAAAADCASPRPSGLWLRRQAGCPRLGYLSIPAYTEHGFPVRCVRTKLAGPAFWPL